MLCEMHGFQIKIHPKIIYRFVNIVENVAFYLKLFFNACIHLIWIGLNCILPFSDIPETKVKLGSSLDPSTIREGTDVYFDCLVMAHPHVYKVEWRHNVSIMTFTIIKIIVIMC